MEIQELHKHADNPLRAVLTDPRLDGAEHGETSGPISSGEVTFQGAGGVSRFSALKETTVDISQTSHGRDFTTSVFLDKRDQRFRFLLNPLLQLFRRGVAHGENRYLMAVRDTRRGGWCRKERGERSQHHPDTPEHQAQCSLTYGRRRVVPYVLKFSTPVAERGKLLPGQTRR